MQNRPIEVLLVEDNPMDVKLFETHLGDSPTDYTLHVVRSGEQALSFLYHGVEYTDAPRPDVVLLDLNLPEMTGFEVLAAIKQHEHLKNIPVIVLTCSTDEDDVARAYTLQANCYLKKPVDSVGFANLIKAIDEFWLQRASFPDR
mgnify:CR=1 FL=1